jgi:hypothetical protein
MRKDLNILSNDIRLKITEKHSGKMLGMQSLSTSVLLNKRCQKYCKIEGSICSKCFAREMMDRYSKNMPDAMAHNTQILTSSILKKKDLPRVNVRYFRLESFGDLNNDIQFINYINICNANKKTTFALWTKNPDIIDDVFNNQGYKKPKNLIIIVSSLFLNLQFKLYNMPYEKRYWFIDGIFTVYTAQYACDNNIDINCLDRKCLECLNCYTKKKGIFYINEIEKKEQKKYKKLVGLE